MLLLPDAAKLVPRIVDEGAPALSHFPGGLRIFAYRPTRRYRFSGSTFSSRYFPQASTSRVWFFTQN